MIKTTDMPAPLHRVWTAAGCAAVFLVLCGVGFRVLDQRLAVASPPPIPPGTLDHMSMQIDDSTGHDVPLPAEVIRLTDTDDHISRGYSRHDGAEAVGLWVAFGTRARDLMPHRPEICYPGAGWVFQDAQDASFSLPQGSPLHCEIQRFTGGALDSREIVVLNYYVVDGQYYADISGIRTRAWHGSSAFRYMAQVQVTCMGRQFGDARLKTQSVHDFAVASASAIFALLPAPNTGASCSPASGSIGD